MRRSRIAIACTLALSLPVHADAGVPEAWKAYAEQAIAPQFSWSRTAPVVAPSVLDGIRERLLAQSDAAAMVALSPARSLQVALSDGSFGFERTRPSRNLFRNESAFSADFAAGTLVQSVGVESALSLTAVIAEQRYATPGFGNVDWQSRQTIGVVHGGGHQEVSHGSGVRLAYDQLLGEGIGWNLTLQSRLDMEAFKTYRGVYSESGDFDVPGFVQAGLRWNPGGVVELSADVQRVFFSDVDTFTSSSLPVRFLSLLGDAQSPEFAWRDQTVLSLEASRRTVTGGRWSLRYSTQQQPRPTAAILDRALSDEYSDVNVALGFEQPLARFGRLRFAASYSPSSYFLGTSPMVRRGYESGSQVEVDAQWTMNF